MDAVSRHAWETSVAMARAEAAMIRASRTQYVVRLTSPSGMYAGANNHWEPVTTAALKFDSMTAANGHAIMALDLGMADYTIEAV